VVLDNIYGGRTILGRILLQLDLCCSLDQAAIVSGSSIYCTCCIPPSILHIYTLIFQTGFPRGGFIQGHVDQKYLCSFSCMLEFRTTLFSAVKISRCVTYILVCMC
jgi:hypothetical protein